MSHRRSYRAMYNGWMAARTMDELWQKKCRKELADRMTNRMGSTAREPLEKLIPDSAFRTVPIVIALVVFAPLAAFALLALAVAALN